MIPFKVTSRDIPLSDSMHAAVEQHMESLERFADRILHCEVILSRPHSHHKKGAAHHVRIQIKMPRKSIIIDREPEKTDRHATFRVALQDAFKLVERKLEGDRKKIRSRAKSSGSRTLRRAAGSEVASDESED